MSTPHPEQIEELLPRYCEGLATADERQMVERWMEQSEENRKTVRQIYALYLATDTTVVMRKVDTEAALKRVKKQMNQSKRTNWWMWAQRIAAVLILPLLLATCWLYVTRNGMGDVELLEVRTNPGMTTSLTLPDGTRVFLNSESSLVYPSRFNEKKRRVRLTGEAYFEVTPDSDKRFIVSTPHQTQVEVLGTCFNVEAYSQSDKISTTLVKGKVDFLFDKDNRQEKVRLTPGQKVIYNSSTHDIQLLRTSGESETSWKEGKIVFRDTPLEEGLHMLEKRYHVAFTIRNERLKENSFTGTFTNQRLERILEYFRLSSQIRWKYIDSPCMTDEKNQIEIY